MSRCFRVRVGAYAIMSNHMHVVLRPDPGAALDIDARSVVRAWWFQRFDVDPETGTDAQGEVVAVDEVLVESLAQDADFVAKWRERLGSASWFMKAVKEPLSRRANREEGCTGAFWEGRFTSVPLLDAAAIAACMVYVDLNPIRAQLAATPETSTHTSVKRRIEDRGLADTTTQEGETPSSAVMARAEPPRRPWLTPIPQVIRSLKTDRDPGMELDTYLRLVDLTGRAARGDKRGAIPSDLPDLLARLDCDAEAWLDTVARPKGLRGSALGGMIARAAEAARRGLAWIQVRCPLFRSEPGAAATV